VRQPGRARLCGGLWKLAAVLVTLMSIAARVEAQAFEGQVGHFFEGDGWTVYRLGLSRPVGSVFGIAGHADYLGRTGGGPGGLAGLGADVSAFRGGRPGPYVLAGVGAGMGSPEDNSFSRAWASWSAGVGYELFPASFLTLGAEARWRAMTLDSREGAEIAAGLTIRFGGRRRARPEQPGGIPARGAARPPGNAPASPPSEDGSRSGDAARLAASVVATASEVMGRPYQWGGTGTGGSGFDCSGLIQYAYGQHGVTLPRRSVDQAREGREVSPDPTKLLPGDVLTFSNTGGVVTHVGLYVGDGRFIHSATRGVQLSTLSADDPYGRWWYHRWVGVRRILQ
jgi:cell wall-associated NlpC family hydrolase